MYALDAPVNQHIDNIKEEYIVGETITCSADGHPDPTIYWLNENTGDILNNPTVLITSDMAGFQTYSCVAWIEIRDGVHQVSRTLNFGVKLTGMWPIIIIGASYGAISKH